MPEQLESMNLQDGENILTFSDATNTLECSLFVWEHNVKVMISDIDGTITKSDVRGMIKPMMGKDWSHPGVC